MATPFQNIELTTKLDLFAMLVFDTEEISWPRLLPAAEHLAISVYFMNRL